MACSNATADQRNQKATVESREIQLSSTQPVIQSASRCMADRTGQGFRQGRTTAPPGQQQLTRASGTGWSNRWTPMDTDRPHWGPCDRLRRSWEETRGPKGEIPSSQPAETRSVGNSGSHGFTNLLGLSHLAPTRGFVRNGGAFPRLERPKV